MEKIFILPHNKDIRIYLRNKGLTISGVSAKHTIKVFIQHFHKCTQLNKVIRFLTIAIYPKAFDCLHIKTRKRWSLIAGKTEFSVCYYTW